MDFTDNQLELIKEENPKVVLELKDTEVLAIYSLGQMNNKVVRLHDNFFGKTTVGVFEIEHINGEKELDFRTDENWREVTIDSISLRITSPNEWGEQSTQFQSLLDIKSIALFDQ